MNSLTYKDTWIDRLRNRKGKKDGQICCGESTPQLLLHMTSRLTSWLNPVQLLLPASPKHHPEAMVTHTDVCRGGSQNPTGLLAEEGPAVTPRMMSKQRRNDDDVNWCDVQVLYVWENSERLYSCSTHTHTHTHTHARTHATITTHTHKSCS